MNTFRWLLGCLLAFCLCPLAMAEPIGYTTTCRDNPAFQEIKTTRLNGYDEQIAKAGATAYTEQLRARKADWVRHYAMLDQAQCDTTTGLPHLIADGRLSNAGDFIIPSILFLWLAGALGWAGRDYLMKTQNPQDEILIDFPKAIQSLLLGLIWPAFAIPQIASGAIRDDKVKP
ncbi:hypothetical protein [Candidatus Cyanaurora vandensis]|uniref:hypothetical protein n=1 Tax=Candidatus Cyanaurora vandensis TaxID=2714958 RepID=UPI00257C4FDE|nr:hypothetical protein [Candidatus Cyanaurora vandensis]